MKNADDLLQEADIQFEAKDFEQAFISYSQAISLLEAHDGDEREDSFLSSIYSKRAFALMEANRGEVIADPDLYYQVLQDYERAIELAPDNVQLSMEKAKLCLQCRFEDMSGDAAAELEALLQLQPGQLEATTMLAGIHVKKEELDKAIQVLDNALKAGSSPELMLQKAQILIRKDPPSYGKALKVLGELESLLPELEDVYVMKARCYIGLENPTAAIREFDKLLEISPGQVQALVDRGALKMTEDPESALEDFNLALEVEADALALNNRAFILRTRGDFALAEQDALNALAADPGATVAYATLAEIYADWGKEDSFFSYLKKAADHYYSDPMELLSEEAFLPYANRDTFREITDGMDSNKN